MAADGQGKNAILAFALGVIGLLDFGLYLSNQIVSVGKDYFANGKYPIGLGCDVRCIKDGAYIVLLQTKRIRIALWPIGHDNV